MTSSFTQERIKKKVESCADGSTGTCSSASASGAVDKGREIGQPEEEDVDDVGVCSSIVHRHKKMKMTTVKMITTTTTTTSQRSVNDEKGTRQVTTKSSPGATTFVQNPVVSTKITTKTTATTDITTTSSCDYVDTENGTIQQQQQQQQHGLYGSRIANSKTPKQDDQACLLRRHEKLAQLVELLTVPSAANKSKILNGIRNVPGDSSQKEDGPADDKDDDDEDMWILKKVEPLLDEDPTLASMMISPTSVVSVPSFSFLSSSSRLALGKIGSYCLLLHLACKYHPECPDLIMYIAGNNKDALTVKDGHRGRIPLHYLLDDSGSDISSRNFNAKTWNSGASSSTLRSSTTATTSNAAKSFVDLIRTLISYFTTRWSFDTYSDENGENLLHTLCRRLNQLPPHVLSLDLVQFIYSLAPNAIKRRLKCQKGRLPLHLAVLSATTSSTGANASISNRIIHFLLDMYPKATSIKDSDKNTLLHLLFRNEVPSDFGIVQRVINMCPTSLHIQDPIGHLPIHVFCGSADTVTATTKNTSAGTIKTTGNATGTNMIRRRQQRRRRRRRIPLQHLQLLAGELPYSVDREYGPGKVLPIHLVIRHAHDDDIMAALQFLIDFNPRTLLSAESYDGGLPIHEACLRNHLEAVTLIADRCPECLDKRHPQLMLPIHCAADFEDPAMLFHLMDRRYHAFFHNNPRRDSSSLGEDERKLYLHAILHDENLPSKEKIVKALMKGVIVRSRRRQEESAGSGKSSVLLSKHSGGDDNNVGELRCERWFDQNGALPLHIAAATRAPTGIIELLVKAYPEAVKVKDIWGRLPLHCDMLNEYPQFDLQSYWPESKSVRDALGCLPIHYACRTGVSWTTIQRLCMPPASIFANASNHRGEYPLHMACERGHISSINSILDLKASDNFVGKPNSDGMTPFLLLAQCDGKGETLKRDMNNEESSSGGSKYLETLWKLLKRNPNVISSGFSNSFSKRE